MSDADQPLRDVLQTIAKEHGYDDYDTVIQQFSTGGANFTSYLYHITLSARDKNDLRLFAKVACVNETMRSQMPFKLFDTETYFYTELLTKYQELEERHNVPPENRLATVKYYGSSVEYLKEVLVLQDLSAEGFVTHDRLKTFEWEYAAKSIVEMAKLHALSIAFFQENPDEITSLHDRFKMIINADQLKQIFQNMMDTILVAVKEENRDKVQKFFQSMHDKEIDHHFKVRRLPVIAHGDFRPSNLMHKEREDGTLKVYALDYQMLRVSNPICDLMFFIFSGSDEKFREKHYTQLLDYYYKELCDALTRLSIDPEKVYTREDFDYELKEVQPYGLTIGIMMTPMLTVEAEKAPDMSESSGIEDFIIKPNELAAARLNGIVEDFVKLGVL